MKKSSLLLLAICMFFIYGQTQAQCISGSCDNGIGVYVFPNGVRYTGQFKDGNILGIGSAMYADGSKYQGEWKSGLPNGLGIKLYPDGRLEKGAWQDGLMMVNSTGFQGLTGCVSGDCINGVGIFVFPSGTIYMGEFSNAIVNGLGACYYIDGHQYGGYWANRLPEGKGVLMLPGGMKQSGIWKNGELKEVMGEINGFDYQKTGSNSPSFQTAASSVDIQWGCLSGDCENGRGVFLFMDGTHYEGDFLNGELHGLGTAILPDGTKVIGQFKYGLQDGEGTVYYSGRKSKWGYWKYGEYIGTDPNAPMNKFQGCSGGDCQNGYGIYAFQDGSKYVGNFVNGQIQGKGMVVYPNGEKYSGELANGKFNGQGTLHVKNGPDKIGFWKDGFFQGENANGSTGTNLSQPGTLPAYSQTGGSNPSQSTPPSSGLYNNPQPSTRPANNQPAGGVAGQNTMTTSGTAPAKIKVWAVIVGVADYRHAPVLQYTDDDAYRVYAFLRSAEGGGLKEEQITILIDDDANKNNVLKTMKNVYGKAGKDDLIIMYFSGHGVQGAFLPSDFDGSNNMLYHKEVNQILDSSPAKYKMCIADACHSGSMFTERSISASAETKLLDTYYETLAKSKAGTALIMSSKSEETSLESSGLRQGIFTHFLIRGLKGEADADFNKIVTVDELFNFVHDNVRSYTQRKQSPMIQGDYDPKMTVAVTQ